MLSKWSISMLWGKRALFSYCFCGALYFLLLVVRLLSLFFPLVYYFLCVSAIRTLLVSLFVCLYAHSFPRCPHLETRVGGMSAINRKSRRRAANGR